VQFEIRRNQIEMFPEPFQRCISIPVTLKWWDDLWLNEGFASYVEYKGVNHAHPDWQIVSTNVPELSVS
jgi:hypothetical protein